MEGDVIESIAARIRFATGCSYSTSVEAAAISVNLLKPSHDESKNRIADLEARCAKYEADSMRLDKLQESFIKGEEFHIVLCEGKNDDEDCEHDTHPHFEAFDWSWRSSPVRASTLRDVIDKALTEGGEHG